jgi:aquaporin Z
MTVAFCIMCFGPVTGAAINPARTLGPAVGIGRLTEALPDMAAQFAGAVVAAFVYRLVFAKALGDEAAEGGADQPAF